ncbi:hypothetical protein Nepgr_027648 [Nepenthes gracilis]|uniref:PHD-type domain-containing protein n=1 Tax=Nepenthes gracilis TaxID=150966 RepID=A0AAD3T8X6_NEPGR|nr:hypothetical protein Nepgr_027648 [Nepenthes gracilis]
MSSNRSSRFFFRCGKFRACAFQRIKHSPAAFPQDFEGIVWESALISVLFKFDSNICSWLSVEVLKGGVWGFSVLFKEMREGLRSSTLANRSKGKVDAGYPVAPGNDKELAGDHDLVMDNCPDFCGNENPGSVSSGQRCRGEPVNFERGMNEIDGRSNELQCERGEGNDGQYKDSEAKNKGESCRLQRPESSANGDETKEAKVEFIRGQAEIIGEISEVCSSVLNSTEKEANGCLTNLGYGTSHGDKGNKVAEEAFKGRAHFSNGVSCGTNDVDVGMGDSECNKDYVGQKERVKEKDLDGKTGADDNVLHPPMLVATSIYAVEDGGCSNDPYPIDDDEKETKMFLDRNGDHRAEMKDEAEEWKAQIFGKVLRSRIVDINGREKEAVGGQRGRGRKRVSDYPEEAMMEMKKDEGIQSVTNLKKKGKGKRGRPRKVKCPDHLEETVMEIGKVERIQSVTFSEKNCKRKRGRPPKAKIEETGALKTVIFHSMKVKSPLKRKRVESRSNLTKTFGADNSSGLMLKKKAQTLESENEPTKHKKEGEVGTSKREKQKFVRKRIVDLLFSAGWKVEYRPRKDGRDYSDAVYVSPEGSTHWSVTKAYYALKKQVEDGDVRSFSKVPNFCFTPVPDEELRALFRVVVNKRVGKKKAKSKQEEEGDLSDEEVPARRKRAAQGKKNKNKSSAKVGGKSHRGRKKRIPSLIEEENAGNQSLKRKPSSFRNGTQNRRRCALMVRSSSQGLNSVGDEFITLSGKCSVLSWMIDSGSLQLGVKVQYRSRTKVKLEGSITRDGIHCGCCGKILLVSEFETHSDGKICQPYENLYLENGTSLLKCMLDLWNKQEEVSGRSGFHAVNIDDDDPNDDTCGICGDGGVLICCDSCPSTFHQGCLNIPDFPSGEWHCLYCSCKFCGLFGGQSSSSLLTCRLCEEKYHQLCCDEKDATYFRSKAPTFCGRNCKQIFELLQRLVGVKCELGDGFTWTLIQRYDVRSNSSVLQPLEIESNSKLVVALSLMHECFLPVVDHRSGINLINNILYSCGSNFKRLNFSGFFTAILERGDEVVSAASIRIHGKKLAEMPFIGTSHVHRLQGMCRRLLGAIESALCSLDVEKLVIPAIPELLQTWTSAFGFKPIDEASKKAMRHVNMLVFPGTNMLEKILVKQQVAEERSSPDSKCDEPGCLNQAIKGGADQYEVHNGSLNGTFDANSSSFDVSKPSSTPRCLVHPAPAVDDSNEEMKNGTDSEGLSTSHAYEVNGSATPKKNDSGQIRATAHEIDEQSVLQENDKCRAGISAPVVSSSAERSLEEASRLAVDTVCEVENRILPSISSEKMECEGRISNCSIDGTGLCNAQDIPVDVIEPSSSLSVKPTVEVTELPSSKEECFLEGDQLAAKAAEQSEPDAKVDQTSVTEFNSESSCNLSSGNGDLYAPSGFLACGVSEVVSK